MAFMNRSGQEYRKKYAIIRPSIVKELAHGTTVSNLAYRVGKQLQLPEEDCYDLALAGFLHDIGKLELAKYVYGKENETLIIEEMRYVRRHSRLGADILAEKGYSPKIVDMVKFHHENCDGSGYPMNLSRNEIPLGSRILRVCDVFAALTADRPYREAFDKDTALELMIEEAKYYDVEVFLAFLNVANGDDVDSILHTEELEETIRRLAYEGGSPFREYLGVAGSEAAGTPGRAEPDVAGPEAAGEPGRAEPDGTGSEAAWGSGRAELDVAGPEAAGEPGQAGADVQKGTEGKEKTQEGEARI